jgi:hypothetical protein
MGMMVLLLLHGPFRDANSSSSGKGGGRSYGGRYINVVITYVSGVLKKARKIVSLLSVISCDPGTKFQYKI